MQLWEWATNKPVARRAISVARLPTIFEMQQLTRKSAMTMRSLSKRKPGLSKKSQWKSRELLMTLRRRRMIQRKSSKKKRREPMRPPKRLQTPRAKPRRSRLRLTLRKLGSSLKLKVQRRPIRTPRSARLVRRKLVVQQPSLLSRSRPLLRK